MLNKQIPIKRDMTTGKNLLVHSIFYTIQGEGPFAGHPAVFVRLGGCNLQCPQCDTEYTDGATWVDINFIRERVWQAWETDRKYGRFNAPLVVITGGEPFRQRIQELVDGLLRNGASVQIETNGTLFEPLPYSHPGLTIVCSPKGGKVNQQLQRYINAYKYVLSADNLASDDGLPTSALGLPAKPARPYGIGVEVYVNPMDEQDPAKNAANLKAAAASAMKYGYILGVQLHKLVGLE